jgi:serine/threonine protein kinase
MDILKKLKSRYIVAVYEGFIVGSKLWLVMEHCVGGSILDVMKMCKIDTLKEPLMKGVIAFLLLALDHLHSHHIIHRVLHTPLLLWCIL